MCAYIWAFKQTFEKQRYLNKYIKFLFHLFAPHKTIMARVRLDESMIQKVIQISRMSGKDKTT